MQITLFENGGPAPPPAMYAIREKYHAITRFAAREGCAACFVRGGFFYNIS